jgi:hypothetical protein
MKKDDQFLYIPTWMDTRIPGLADPCEREEEEEFNDESFRG